MWKGYSEMQINVTPCQSGCSSQQYKLGMYNTEQYCKTEDNAMESIL
jgi:hypothetical protein